MKKVLIASRNPVKINATKKAFEEVFTDRFEFEGVSADSLVSDQPMVPEGVKTEKSDELVTKNFVQKHITIGIESLNELINNGITVRHHRFE